VKKFFGLVAMLVTAVSFVSGCTDVPMSAQEDKDRIRQKVNDEADKKAGVDASQRID
jgi:hypothetical protein